MSHFPLLYLIMSKLNSLMIIACNGTVYLNFVEIINEISINLEWLLGGYFLSHRVMTKVRIITAWIPGDNRISTDQKE